MMVCEKKFISMDNWYALHTLLSQVTAIATKIRNSCNLAYNRISQIFRNNTAIRLETEIFFVSTQEN